MRTLTIRTQRPYNALIAPGLLDRAGQEIARVLSPCRAVLVTDDTVDALYGDKVLESLHRAGFDAALDRLGTFVLAILTAYLLEMALSMVISSLIVALNLGLGSSPNNDAFVSMIPEGRSRIIAMTVFMAPIVEEVLFRGLVFGALQRRSRALAWVVSVLAFSLYHVWQYVVEAQSAAMLLYALLYIPASMSFNWCYERSGSIWAPIVYHMLSNAISMSLLA